MSNYHTIICPLCSTIFEDEVNSICDCGFLTTTNNLVVVAEDDSATDTHVKCPNCDEWQKRQSSCPWTYWCDCGAEFSYGFMDKGIALTALFVHCDICGSEFDNLKCDRCDCEE